MVFVVAGGGFHDGNASHWWDQKHHLFPSHIFSENTNWETAAIHISVAEQAIRKATGRVNAPLECWGCTNSPIYHAYRFHTYRNCPNNMYPDVAERVKRSIQQYAQRNSAMGGSRGSQGIQYVKGHTYSTTKCSTLATRRSHIYQSWNKEVFSSLYQAFLMCEMVDPSTFRSERVAYAAAIKNDR